MNDKLVGLIRTLAPEDKISVREFLRELSRQGYFPSVRHTHFGLRSVSTGNWWWPDKYTWETIPYPFLTLQGAQDVAMQISSAVDLVELQSLHLSTTRIPGVPGKKNYDEPKYVHVSLTSRAKSPATNPYKVEEDFSVTSYEEEVKNHSNYDEEVPDLGFTR